MKIKVATIVGARPQFVKAAPVSRALRADPRVTEIIVHTGQHYDANLSSVFFGELTIPEPDHHLGIGSAPHGAQTGRMLEAIEQVLLRERPDWTLVFGDTNSTLAGALAAAKQQFRVAHVEAGLRAFNRRMPEEMNRVLTDHACDLLLAPTDTAVTNLRREGIPDRRIHQVGDVMYDAALFYGVLADERSPILSRLNLRAKQYVLCTIHRAENTDDPGRLGNLIEGLRGVARRHVVVLPLHPRTHKALRAAGLLGDVPANLRLLESVGYLDMVKLEKHARVVATDSGGVQKEAFFHGVPCVTLRTETEWVELVALGWNRVVPPTSAAHVCEGILSALDSSGATGRPYGEGNAAQRIVARLLASDPA